MVLHAKELGVDQLIYEVFNINWEVQPLMVTSWGTDLIHLLS